MNKFDTLFKQIHDEAKEAPRGRHFKKGSDRTYKNGHASDGNPEGGPRLNSDPTYKNPNESNVQEDGHRDVESVNNQIHTAIKALKTIKDQVNKLSDDTDLPSWWTNKVAIAIDKLDGMADYIDSNVPEQIEIEEKQRLDPKCWKGYRKQGTKVKDGVRVNNCVKIKK